MPVQEMWTSIGWPGRPTLNVVLRASSVYTTTGASPYVYRNCMVCILCMGDNEMHGLYHRVVIVPILCQLSNVCQAS